MWYKLLYVYLSLTGIVCVSSLTNCVLTVDFLIQNEPSLDDDFINAGLCCALQVVMPKKFRGENSKSVEARARKAAQKEAEVERHQRQVEDEYWKEEDKNVLKKLQRKVLHTSLGLTTFINQFTVNQSIMFICRYAKVTHVTWLAVRKASKAYLLLGLPVYNRIRVLILVLKHNNLHKTYIIWTHS